MSESLVPCSACRRHVRAGESSCPFCRASRVGAAAVVAGALCLGALVHDASAQPVSPRLQMEHAPAQGYGAPPLDPSRLGVPGERHVVRPARVRTRVTVRGPRNAPVTESVRAAVTRDLAVWSRCRELAPTTPTLNETLRVPLDVGMPRTPRRGPAVQRDVVGQCVNARLDAMFPASPRRLTVSGHVTVEFHFEIDVPDGG